MKYIQYEIDLLSLLRIRRQVGIFTYYHKSIVLLFSQFCFQKIGYHHKKSEIDHTIAKRINKIFNMAVSRFPSDTKIWLSQIEFCKKMVNTIILTMKLVKDLLQWILEHVEMGFQH